MEIIKFNKPTNNEIQLIKKASMSLLVVNIDHFLTNTERRIDNAIKCDLQTAIANIESYLKEDFSENNTEARTVSWLFEYVVEIDQIGQLFILTRLFSSDKSQGSVFYGSCLIRTGEDQYFLWIDS